MYATFTFVSSPPSRPVDVPMGVDVEVGEEEVIELREEEGREVGGVGMFSAALERE